MTVHVSREGLFMSSIRYRVSLDTRLLIESDEYQVSVRGNDSSLDEMLVQVTIASPIIPRATVSVLLILVYLNNIAELPVFQPFPRITDSWSEEWSASRDIRQFPVRLICSSHNDTSATVTATKIVSSEGLGGVLHKVQKVPPNFKLDQRPEPDR